MVYGLRGHAQHLSTIELVIFIIITFLVCVVPVLVTFWRTDWKYRVNKVKNRKAGDSNENR